MVRAVSDKWVPTSTASHEIVVRVEIRRAGEILAASLPVAGGTVTHDLGSDITASAQVEVADPKLLPRAWSDMLAPYGNELCVYRGLKYPFNVSEELLVFAGPLVSTPTWTGDGRGFTVKAEGWSRYVKDDRFLAPYTPTGTYRSCILELLAESVPGVPVTFDPATGTEPVPDGLLFEEDRWEALTKLAEAVGCTVRDTARGGIVVAPDPVPDPDTEPVRVYAHGQRGALLSGTAPELTREERYNAVVATNPEDETVRAVATVDDPGSPVRWNGPFGRKVLYYSSPLLTTGNAAQAAATRLAGLSGRTRAVEAEVLPDASVELGDHVLLRWPPHQADGLLYEEVAQVRRIELPLAPGPMKLALRGVDNRADRGAQ